MSEFQLWHRRLGHVGFDHLIRIGGLDLLRGLPKLKATNDIVCAPCRHGKQVSASHPPINLVNTTRPAQLLHMDTVGPSRVRSAGGKWYVLVIVDDFSRYSWVFFMDHKSEAFNHFHDLALRLFNVFPGEMKTIRSDNGLEFKNSSFIDFLAERGV